jgi:type IV secretory pathway VirB10-like protein
MAPGNGPENPVQPLNGPAGLDVGAQVPKVARVSRRVLAIVGAMGLLMILGVFFGLKHRANVAREAAAAKEVDTRPITPATQRGVDLAKLQDNQKGAAPASAQAAGPQPVYCTVDPVSGQPDKFERASGQPCTHWVPVLQPQARMSLPPAYARSSVAARPAPPPSSPPPSLTSSSPPVAASANPVKDREREAMLVGMTTAHTGAGVGSSFVPAVNSGSAPVEHSAQDAIDRATARLATFRQSPAPSGDGDGSAQAEKERFIANAQKHAEQDYLPAVRIEALSPYEIRAGWIIPAVLEQRINSDLPGDVRALVMSNVYDTATGAYLLIPQGARMVGKYDSRVTYGQSNVQVVWDRLIYPDGSALNLDGMAGMESEGDAGLHDQVDRHYKRIFGFAALTSMMSAGLAMTQQMGYGNSGYYGYPSAGDLAAQAAGREMTQAGMEITRKNINVQPTLKVRAGERFAVSVNRDIIFDGPYVPRAKRR